MTDHVKELYEPRIRQARERIGVDPGIQRLFEQDIEPRLLERFLIQFCALGVHMTEPVEGWIRRAGQRCIDVGLEEVGRALMSHAVHEANHHEMMIADTRYLVSRWNARQRRSLDADRVLGQEVIEATRDYVQLHEATIAGSQPFGQVAIEYEIEGLSVRLGPKLVERCVRMLGQEVIGGLSFISEHVALDVGHTKLNERMMNRLLSLHPEMGPALADTGAKAIAVYVRFLNGCLSTAAADLESEMESEMESETESEPNAIAS